MGFVGASIAPRIGGDVFTGREFSSLHPANSLARSSCRREVSGVDPDFYLLCWLTVISGGANIVSHCDILAQAFLPSTIVALAFRSEFAVINGQSTLRPSNVAMIKSVLFFGIVSGRRCTKPYSKRTRAVRIGGPLHPAFCILCY